MSQELFCDDDVDDTPPVPALPPNIDHLQGKVLLKSIGADAEVGQVLKAGILALKRRGWPVRREAGPSTPIETSSGGDSSLLPAFQTVHDGLSIISELGSEASSSTTRSSPQSRDGGRNAGQATVTDEHGSEDIAVYDRDDDQPSETATDLSPDATTSRSGTPVTSLGDLVGSEMLSPEMSDSDDTMSDVTDYTDVSLLEAFDSVPTPFSPVLLLVAVKVKEEVVSRVRQTVQILLQSPEGQRCHQNGSGSDSSASGPSSANGPSSQNQTNPKKRFHSEEEDGGGPNRGDGERRKRSNTAHRTALETQLRRFACPFCKRYPHKKWARACLGPGWTTVHRVK